MEKLSLICFLSVSPGWFNAPFCGHNYRGLWMLRIFRFPEAIKKLYVFSGLGNVLSHTSLSVLVSIYDNPGARLMVRGVMVPIAPEFNRPQACLVGFPRSVFRSLCEWSLIYRVCILFIDTISIVTFGWLTQYLYINSLFHHCQLLVYTCVSTVVSPILNFLEVAN